FQPIRRPPVPVISKSVISNQSERASTGLITPPLITNHSNPIDAFLLAKLDAQGFGFNPEADKPTLIRRVTLDLTGLPPTPEMVAQPLKNLTPDAIEKLTATGFLRMAPDGTASAAASDQKIARNAVVAETLKVVSSSLLGMTVGCAQCHDHRHDPIPQADYYR